MIITLTHLRTVPGFHQKPGFCLPHSRAWAKRHGIDWRDFCRHGVAEETLLAVGDAFAIALVKHAHEVSRGGE